MDNLVEFIDQEISSLTILISNFGKSNTDNSKELFDFYRGWKHGLEVLKDNIQN